tara:strand:+ start:189967 stop:191013 length:1047 start_codon:yes stop_codon:yes gene_type:complete
MKNIHHVLMIFIYGLVLSACQNDEPSIEQSISLLPDISESKAGRMLQPNALIHVVNELEPSVAFYRDAVGFELVSGPGPLSGSALLQRLQVNAPDSSGQIAVFNIPGSEMDLQLIEFSGLERKPFTQRLYDPGVTRFSISVRDIDVAFAAVQAYNVIVDSTGGEPVYTQRPRNETRAVMMRDLDGFVFEFVESGNPVETDVPESSNIYNARSSLALENLERSLEFYRDILGYEAAQPNTVNEAVLRLEGTPDAIARTSRTQPPGSTNVWFFWEFSNIARTKQEPSVQDPGASAISLLVEGLPALLNQIRAAGFQIETPGGLAVSLGSNRLGALVRSPDGLLVELVENL